MPKPCKPALAAIALSALLAACNPEVSEPEPANETVAAEMPQTPDMGAAAEGAAGASTPAAAPDATAQPGKAAPPAG